ncbi:MAG: CPBP family intramembrane metalloprotease [Ruminococcaceae bacterium]|nr:CPBP family intramembrane metalloprotease [Oscillospiraceae bacterium]
MHKFIPERPKYRKERLWVGFPLLTVFSLLFLFRILDRYTGFSLDSIWAKLIAIPVVFLIPTIVFLLLRGQGYSRVLRLRAPHAIHIPLLLSAFVSLLSGCILLSILCGGIETLGNSSVQYEAVRISDPMQGVLLTFILAICPAILEELLFRGIVTAEYERRGAMRGVLMSALLFALCHFDLRNLLVYLFSGVLFALVLFATDSLFCTMLLHIFYNIASLFGQRYLNAFYHFTGSVELFLFLLILLLLLSLILFLRFAAMLYRRRERNGQSNPQRDVPRNVQFYTILDALKDPPVVLCILLSILGFIFL